MTGDRRAAGIGEMCIRICLPSYKLLYESGSEETLYHQEAVDEGLVERARMRHEERQKSRILC